MSFANTINSNGSTTGSNIFGSSGIYSTTSSLTNTPLNTGGIDIQSTDTITSFTNNNIIFGGGGNGGNGGNGETSNNDGNSGTNALQIESDKIITNLINLGSFCGGAGGGAGGLALSGIGNIGGIGGDGSAGGGGGGGGGCGNAGTGGNGGNGNGGAGTGGEAGYNGGGGGGGNFGGSGGSGAGDNGCNGGSGGGGQGVTADSFQGSGGGGAGGGNGGNGTGGGSVSTGGGGSGGGAGGILSNTPSYGGFKGGDGGYSIYNLGQINTLENKQGNGFGLGALFYRGNLPTNYNTIIQSDASYGQLFCSGWANPTPKTLANFNISSLSTLPNITTKYDSVLVNIDSVNGQSQQNVTGAFSNNGKNYIWLLTYVAAGSPNTFGRIVSISGTNYSSYDLTITLFPAPAFTISPSVQTATLGIPFQGYSITSTGSPIESYSILPNLPAGLTFSSVTGLITGTPFLVSPATTYTITAINAGGSVSQPYTLTVQSYPCFKEGSKILTDKGYTYIQELRKGDLVKTLLHGFKPIDLIGKREIHHQGCKERIKDQLYCCDKDAFEEVFEPLIITGCHSILVENSVAVVNAEQIEKVKEVNGGIYLTDDKLRLPACVDLRTSVYPVPGTYTIYHLALENDDYYMNYGIYANGLLVETCSKRYLKELSGMELF